MLDADPSSFEVLQSGFARDKDNLFYAYNGTWSIGDEVAIEGASPTTFEKLSSRLAKDQNQVYYLNTPTYEGFPRLRILDTVDPESFKVIFSSSFHELAIDDRTVFYNGRMLLGADPNSIRTFAFSGGLFADSDAVYVNGEVNSAINATNFDIISYGELSAIANDGKHCYLITVSGNDGQYLEVEVLEKGCLQLNS